MRFAQEVVEVTFADISRCHLFIYFTTLCLSFSLSTAIAGPLTIVIDGKQEGRRFDGIGGVSAGAQSRLLRDYEKCGHTQELQDILGCLL